MEKKIELGIQFTAIGIIWFQLLDLIGELSILFVLGVVFSILGTIITFHGIYTHNL